MTLGAMAIAIGLVIDDAVVITENIARHLALGGARVRAIREAVQELIWPVTTSTITTVVVFLPLGLLQGVVGQFFAALATTLTLAVLVSLLLALTVIPLLAEQFVTPHEVTAAATGPLARVQQALDRLAPRSERPLAAVLHHPRRIVVAAAVLVAAGLGLWRLVGTGFLPEMDESAFVLDYFTPGGTALAETNRQVGVAEAVLPAAPEITGTSRRTGAELGMFATAQNSGDIIARLPPRSGRSRDVFAVIDDVRDRIGAAVPRLHIEFMQILADVINDLAGAARPVEVKLYGERLDTLEAYARRLAPALERIAGLADLYNGVSEPTAELLMRVNQAVADPIGMTGVGVALGGQYASQQEAFRGLLLVLGLAVVSVCAVMVVQFESFVEPLVVLLVAPVSFVGALALLLATGTALNVSSFMGLILLVGLIVKNGIILLDFTRLRMLAERLPLEAAIREAARVRLRPILMTTLCTLFGLLPLALGIGTGSELQRPLALAVIGGLALSTPITLFAVPTLLVAIRGRDYLIPALGTEHQ